MKQLTGHTGPETAFVVQDYPYGFRLRCQIRYWVETRDGFGQRFVSQTSNPKRPGLVWNKSKAGTYHALAAMYQDEATGYVKYVALSPYADAAEEDAFEREWELDEWQRNVLALRRKARAAYEARKTAVCIP